MSLGQVVSHVLGVFGRALWPSLVLTFLTSFFYLYCTGPVDAGKGWRAAVGGWARRVRSSRVFRRLLLLVFYAWVVVYSTLLGRAFCPDPLMYAMGGWRLWSVTAAGIVPVMSGLENVAMLAPVAYLVLWTYGDRLPYARGAASAATGSAGLAFVCSFAIEGLQLVLHLGTWQLADITYNALGGALGGLLWWLTAGRRMRRPVADPPARDAG